MLAVSKFICIFAAESKIKNIMTRRDLTVVVIALSWLFVNIATHIRWVESVSILTNIICLTFVAAFVFYSKMNKELNNWLNEKI